MKQLLAILLALSLLPAVALAQAAGAADPALHLLWNIPYGGDANTVIAQAAQNAGIQLAASTTAEDGTVTAIGLAQGVNATYFNQPLQSIQFDLSPAAQAPDGKGYGAAYLVFNPPAAQNADEAAAYVAALYGAARETLGEPTQASMSCVFEQNADYNIYDAPLNNGTFDNATMAMAMAENMMVSITFYFNNVQLIVEYSHSFSYVGLNYYAQTAVVPTEMTLGYYKSVGPTAAPDFTQPPAAGN